MCRKNNKTVSILFACLLLLLSCKKDKPAPSNNNTPPVYSDAKSVYAVCEGSFGNGNSALTLFRPGDETVYEDVFKSANNEQLGDVFQSMTRIGNYLYLCINNSDKIVVIDRQTWENVGTIPVSKPRYIAVVSETKAYVSSLYSNKLTIINPKEMEVTGTVTMPGNNPEGMLFYKEKLYVTLWDTAVNKLYSVNASNEFVNPVQTLAGSAPKYVLADREGKLWVMGGNIQKGKKASLTRIDPANGQVVRSFVFPDDADPLKPVFDNEGNTLYFIEVNYTGASANNGIYRMTIADATLPATAFIQAANLQYFWALGLEPGTGNVYVGDPLGFTQRGRVYIYDRNGSELNHFDCGVGPGHIFFDQ